VENLSSSMPWPKPQSQPCQVCSVRAHRTGITLSFYQGLWESLGLIGSQQGVCACLFSTHRTQSRESGDLLYHSMSCFFETGTLAEPGAHRFLWEVFLCCAGRQHTTEFLLVGPPQCWGYSICGNVHGFYLDSDVQSLVLSKCLAST
jgi:hypothetical protein